MEKNLKILIVEDTYFNRVLLDSLLKEWGYTPLAAISAESALSILKSENPDLVLLDLMLPGMDGFMFLEEKKSLNNNTPVIILSAKSDKESLLKSAEFGVNDFITKPYNAIDLKNKLTNFFTAK
jgi:CheY-like chemotaxis protein